MIFMCYTAVEISNERTDCQGDLEIFFFRVDFEKNEGKHNAADANKKHV
jgi:hypothetical protein